MSKARGGQHRRIGGQHHRILHSASIALYNSFGDLTNNPIS